jgi:adenine-specific DNA-methyltransferase
MYPRLKLAKNLLTEDGVIFISIDDNEYENLKKICNEIFGENNYVNTIVWHYGKMSNEKNRLANNHEYVLVYRKTDAGGIFAKIKKEESEYRNRYIRYLTSDNKVLYGSVKDSTDNLILLRVKKIKEELGKAELDLEDVLFDFDKEYKSHSDTIYIPTIKGNAQENISEFDTGQKPLDLIQLLIQLGLNSNEGLVLDFFAGSGTTAEAILALNKTDQGKRKFILVQLPEKLDLDTDDNPKGVGTIPDLIRWRLNNFADKEVPIAGGEVQTLQANLDSGFRTFRLAESNFPTWIVSSGAMVSELENHINELAYFSVEEESSFNSLVEILIKLDFPLDMSITPLEHQALDSYKISDDSFIAVTGSNRQPSLEDFAILLDMKPSRLLVMEDIYKGSDELKTNLEQECANRNIELIKK